MTATRHLADVNVLLALLWPRHIHHIAAQKWFAAQGHQSWATNTIVQLGAIRLLTNSAIVQGAVSASAALRAMSDATSHANHQFWPLNEPVSAMIGQCESLPKGHRHWTDLILLRHAIERKGRLVTFDRGVAELAREMGSNRFLVLNA